MHLVNGTGNCPSPGQPPPGVVKQDKSSGGSVDTTKTRSGPQRVGMCSGERPIGAAKGKQSDTEALRQTPPLAPATSRGMWWCVSHTHKCVRRSPHAKGRVGGPEGCAHCTGRGWGVMGPIKRLCT